MKHLLLTLALLAPLALAACDNKSEDTTTTTGSIENPSAMEPAAGDEAAATTDAAEPTTTSDSMTTTTPSGDTVTTTTTTTTEAPAAEGVAVGEPNPATPAANSCGDHSAWVGKKQADIQTELDAMGDKVRVLGPDSAATMDFNAERTNVKVDANGVVTEVTCG